MRLLLFICLILGLFFFLPSCAYKQDQILFEQKGPLRDSSTIQKSVANISKYRIKPQDILQIRNLQNSKNIVDLTPAPSVSSTQISTITPAETYQVEEDGSVALTGLGHVQVAGLTRVQAMKLIENLYHEKYLKAPIIELKIINLKVTLLGEIKTQGNFSLVKDKTTLVEMIGEAGGLTEKADEKNVEIIRDGETNPIVIRIDLNDINSISDTRTVLQSGDIIYIAENKRAIRADKNQTFSALIQPGLLILSTALLIYTVIHR